MSIAVARRMCPYLFQQVCTNNDEAVQCNFLFNFFPFYGCYLFPQNGTIDLQSISLDFCNRYGNFYTVVTYVCMNGQTDRQMDRIMGRQTDIQVDRSMNGWTCNLRAQRCNRHICKIMIFQQILQFLQKALRTIRPMDQQTNPPMDRCTLLLR